MAIVHDPIELDVCDAARFWIWVEKGEGCWEWQGRIGTGGYGRLSVRGGSRFAHRIAWTLTNGPIPDGQVIDHMCHNKACVNPEHLRLATHKQNSEHLAPVRATSGFRGVHRCGKRWRGCVVHHRVKHHTDIFDSPEEANDAVIALRNELYTHNLLDRA